MTPIPEGWTTIATRSRDGAWEPLPRAIVSVFEAYQLRTLGRIELRETPVGRRVMLAIRATSTRN